MQRVRIDHFRKRNGEYVPFVRMPDDSLREVFLSLLPGTQESFVSAPEMEVLYSGARAPGKTRALIADFLQDVGQGYGAAYKGLILRPTLQGFDEIKSLAEQMILPLFGGSVSFNINRHEYSFASGEILRFGYIQDAGDFAQYQGTSRQFLGFDEVTQFPDDGPYRNMLSTLRPSGGSAKIRLRVRSTCNPSGKGHGWVKARFKCDDLHMQGFRVGPHIPRDESGLDRRVIYGHLQENARILAVQPDYLLNLQQSAARPGELESWTLGSWAITSGGLFDADIAETSKYCMLPPGIPPKAFINHGRLVCAYDFGDSSPFCFLYAIISDGSDLVWAKQRFQFNNGDVIIFGELYGCVPGRPNTGVRWTIEQQRDALFQFEIQAGIRWYNNTSDDWCRRPVSAVADNQIFNPPMANVGSSIAEQFRARWYGGSQRGIEFTPADKSPGSRVQGWQAIRSHLHGTVPKEDGTRERPGLFFANCPHLIRTLSALPRNESDLEDCPPRSEDHAPDSLRYLLRSNHDPQAIYAGSIHGFNSGRRRLIGP